MRNALSHWLKAAGSVLCFAGVLSAAQAAEPRYVDQGSSWTKGDRNQFYTQDQGSRIMPLSWFTSLRRSDGSAFLADNLQRYGYLPNPGNSRGLPVGFTPGNWQGTTYIGMTCAACHTRQIMARGTEYRIDGGPAIVDFQALLKDLDQSATMVLASDANFTEFAQRVLGAQSSTTAVVSLRQQVQDWYASFHAIMSVALPTPGWGPGRLDAVGMILNRVTGLDIGTTPDHIIAENLRPADAPARYPFLWNAPKQDLTQWPGFAPNGSPLLGVARNLGEVYGVFAIFHPQAKHTPISDGTDFRTINSANFSGLLRLEKLVEKMGWPRWPFGFGNDHAALVAQGKTIFERSVSQGGCAECHGIKDGIRRDLIFKTWATPMSDVGTDSREYRSLDWTAKTGTLSGAQIPFVTDRLKDEDRSFNVLRTSVVGAVLERVDIFAIGGTNLLDRSSILAHAMEPRTTPPTASGEKSYQYEARVLQGIWAAAPYLHNGSVPTLTDLLNPSEQRPRSFKIGPNYDIDKAGIAEGQTMFDQTFMATGCEARDSGNSNCGHLFGTWLSPEEKRALLEYLKQL